MGEKITEHGNMQAEPARVIATGRVRMNLAVHHMMGSAHFAKQVLEIEAQAFGQPFGEFYSEIIWNASAVNLLSVAGVEAYINEIFLDARNYFSEESQKYIAEKWEEIERVKVLEKYQKALLLKGRTKIPKGQFVYQKMQGLIKARNALIHFQPQWHDEERSHREIEQWLKGRFDTSPFVDEGAPFFPNKCMTYGFAKWAVDTATDFIDEFCERFGVPNKLEKFRDRISLSKA